MSCVSTPRYPRRRARIDLHLQLRLVQLQRDVRIDDAELRRAQAQRVAVFGERFQIRAAQREIELGTAAAEVEGLDVVDAASAGPCTCAAAPRSICMMRCCE